MWFLAVILILWWTMKRHDEMPLRTAGSQSGGWHPPRQTARLGGSNITGNTWNNGTAVSSSNFQWSGYDAGNAGMVYATGGGEDGLDPASTIIQPTRSEVTQLPRFAMIGSGDPSIIGQVPIRIDTINDVVRRT